MKSNLTGPLGNLEEKIIANMPRDPFDQPMSFEVGTRAMNDMAEMPHRLKYSLTLRVGVSFVANQAEYQSARQNALVLLADTLYSDVISDLARIQHAVSDGRKNESLKMIAALIGRLRK